MRDHSSVGSQVGQSRALVVTRPAPIIIRNTDLAVRPPRRPQKASHRILKIAGVVIFAVASAGAGYVVRDQDIRKSINYHATLAFTRGVVTMSPTENGRHTKSLTDQVAYLFNGQKGPRADRVAEAMGYGNNNGSAERTQTANSELVSRRTKSSSLALDQKTEAPHEDQTGVSASATIFLTGLNGFNNDAQQTTIAVNNPTPISTITATKYRGDWDGLLKNANLSPEQPRSGTLFGGLTEDEFRERELRCMATAIYFEARDEPIKGQIAVGQVIMNRIRSPYYPKTICGVVYQGERLRTGCQFSFTCTGRPARVTEKEEWATSVKIAKQVIAREVWVSEVANATHYHATYVHPDWRHELDKVAVIGTHIFYKPKPGTLQVALLNDEGAQQQ